MQVIRYERFLEMRGGRGSDAEAGRRKKEEEKKEQKYSHK